MKRCRTEGEAGLQDRPSRPHRLARRLPRHRHRQVERARRKRRSSLRIASHYALLVTMLQRLQLNRLPSLAPPQPLVRYEHAQPGALLHLDIKRLGRIKGTGAGAWTDQARLQEHQVPDEDRGAAGSEWWVLE
ncbi:MAG: hypothetical protein IT355_12810 [Gemmatimonadaceae bacterium]|nr:hypothetical protein [Gemmatimonadaceae bacterium]